MPRFANRTPTRRRATVRSRLVRAALLMLVPIFSLEVLGFVQLSTHSERFSAVASEAAMEMRLVDRLLTDLDAADMAGYEFLDDGTSAALVRFKQVGSKVDAGMATAAGMNASRERLQAQRAGRLWTRSKRRIANAQELAAVGRPVPAAFDDAHDEDMTAADAAVLEMLDSSQSQIGAQVATRQSQRKRDLTLLALEIVLGMLIAAWVVVKLTRETVRPLARLGVAADRLRAGHRSERVELDGPAEVAGLGATFNVMADTLETQEAELRRIAFSDALTGLPNRTAFVERVESMAPTGRVAVLFLDLDDFKSVNDALGHAAGDALLDEAARRICAAAGPSSTVARLGGDEFAILVPERIGEDIRRDAVTLAERVLADLAAPLTIVEVQLSPAASVGIAVGPPDAESLLREADVAMYEAKRAGRGRHATFKPAMQEVASRRLAGIADLRQALAKEQFRVLYQPIVDLRTRSVRATEALVRWEHPTRGLVSPAEFIPLAEQTGLIVGIGEWVLREACMQAAAWEASHPDSGRSMTVNLSTRQLLEPDLVDQVATALSVSGLPPGHLMLEMTESAVMADPAAATARLHALRRLGVRLALDDFGTGHSSLAYLRELPVSDLKIAREFVSEMENSPHDLALARGILSLGHGLGLRVIAEGIETDAQHARLGGMGCDLAQGYLYARPLEAKALAAMLDTSLQPPDLPGFVATTTPDSVFRAALGRLPDVAVIAFDSELRVTMADGVVLERVGWRPDEWMGHRLAQVLPAARAQALDRVWSAALRGEHHQLDWQTVRGGRRLSLDIGPIRTDDGAVIGGMLVARDVTPEAGEPSSVETADLGARASLTA